MKLRVAMASSAVCLVSACASQPTSERPIAVASAETHPGWAQSEPAHRSPHDACASGAAEAEDIQLLRTITVVAAGPIYAPGHSDLGRSDDHVAGTKIVFRQPDGVWACWMTHILRCHAIRTLLGVITAPPDVPFRSPERGSGSRFAPKLERCGRASGRQRRAQSRAGGPRQSLRAGEGGRHDAGARALTRQNTLESAQTKKSGMSSAPGTVAYLAKSVTPADAKHLVVDEEVARCARGSAA